MSSLEEARAIVKESDVIDLHIDSFIWHRIFGYDPRKRHGRGLLGARFSHQVDLPRLRTAGINSATWVITTNPLRSASGRARAFDRNIRALCALLSSDAQTTVVGNYREYALARRSGKHAAWIGVQGGNAFGGRFGLIEEHARTLLRVTVTHLTNSPIGAASTPWVGGKHGLRKRGHELIEALNANRVLVDLAHVARPTFFDALATHSKSLPPVVTHTGIHAIKPSWRNLTDKQVRAIADRGGVIGIIFEVSFLARWGRASRATVLDHLEHVIRIAGEDVIALGSDWDGFIRTPRDMPTCLELPLLVQGMLQRNWSKERIQKVLGANALRVIKEVRP